MSKEAEITRLRELEAENAELREKVKGLGDVQMAIRYDWDKIVTPLQRQLRLIEKLHPDVYEEAVILSLTTEAEGDNNE